jgi:ADP-ribose pyrophosphatase YjhB (NUDIX family)
LSGKKPAYGGVVMDAQGRILLREPSDQFEGTSGDFQRTPEGGETPEETALRETCGETGVLAEIIGRVPLD